MTNRHPRNPTQSSHESDTRRKGAPLLQRNGSLCIPGPPAIALDERSNLESAELRCSFPKRNAVQQTNHGAPQANHACSLPISPKQHQGSWRSGNAAKSSRAPCASPSAPYSYLHRSSGRTERGKKARPYLYSPAGAPLAIPRSGKNASGV